MKKGNYLVLIMLAVVVGATSLSPSSFSVEIVTSQPESSSFLDGDVEYLIITSELFEKDVERLALWKSMKGLNALIVTVEDIESTYFGPDTQVKIKECITDYYTNNGTEFVVLAGDHQHVPSRMVWINESYSYDGNYVACDTYYADLDNDWDSYANGIYGEDEDDWNVTAEVYVGRLSANNVYEMGDLVSRILMYESNPPVGDWMNSTLFAGAMTYFDADYDAPGDNSLDYPESDANRFFNYVYDQLFTDMTVTFLAEDAGVVAGQSDYPHNDSLTAESLESEISKGASIAGVYGHGNPSGIYRTIWDADWDGDGLFDWTYGLNEWPYGYDDKHSEYMIRIGDSDFSAFADKPSVMYIMGCSNGNFTHEEALTEYLLKEVCIGTIGGHNIVWGEDNWTERSYGGWYDEGLAFRFYEQLDTYDQPGKAFALAKQDYMVDNITLNMSETTWYDEPRWSEKTLKQFNYFGDPELHIWMDIPETLDGTITGINSSAALFEVTTSQSGAIDAVTVTVTENNETVIWQGSTNSTGEVTLPYNSSILENYTVVAYKPTYIPYLSQELPPARPRAPILSDISPSRDRDGTIDLNWGIIENVDYFNIYRSLNEIPELDGLVPIANTTDLNYQDAGLTNGLHFYVVTAINIGGESGPSNNVMVQVKKLDIPGYSVPLAITVGCITIIGIAYSIYRKKRQS